jgi:hypothetical protein
MASGLAAKGFQIVAGHHRVVAARALGWTEIDAIVIEEGGHLEAELIEIDENLCRSELTASQRSKAVKRRREIWGALHPVEKVQVGQVVPPESATGYKQPPPQEKAFAAETAEASGMTKSSINRHLARPVAQGHQQRATRRKAHTVGAHRLAHQVRRFAVIMSGLPHCRSFIGSPGMVGIDAGLFCPLAWPRCPPLAFWIVRQGPGLAAWCRSLRSSRRAGWGAPGKTHRAASGKGRVHPGRGVGVRSR